MTKVAAAFLVRAAMGAPRPSHERRTAGGTCDAIDLLGIRAGGLRRGPHSGPPLSPRHRELPPGPVGRVRQPRRMAARDQALVHRVRVAVAGGCARVASQADATGTRGT